MTPGKAKTKAIARQTGRSFVRYPQIFLIFKLNHEEKQYGR